MEDCQLQIGFTQSYLDTLGKWKFQRYKGSENQYTLRDLQTQGRRISMDGSEYLRYKHTPVGFCRKKATVTQSATPHIGLLSTTDTLQTDENASVCQRKSQLIQLVLSEASFIKGHKGQGVFKWKSYSFLSKIISWC